MGADAVEVIRGFDGSQLPEGVHPTDASDALIDILREIAARDPAPLMNAEDMMSVFALGSARPSQEVIARLAALLREGDEWTRYAAASSLIAIATPEAAEALLPAFADSASLVQFIAVDAAMKNAVFRRREILRSLQRIAKSGAIREHSPGTWERARDLLALLEISPTAGP